MRRQLQCLVEELKRLKREGVRTVNVSDEALAGLRASLQVCVSESPERIDPAVNRDETGAPFAGSGRDGATREPRSERPAEASGEGKRAVAEPSGHRARQTASDTSAPIPSTPPDIRLPDGDKAARWAALREQVIHCPVCRAHVRPGFQVVFGVGDVDADIFFVGEAPGAEEEKKGEPFVGPAGDLLNRIIGAMGLKRAEVYIGNIMNWRPETPSMARNRPPTAEEMAFCLPYLRAQIEIVQPKILVALGATAVTGLLGPDPNRRMGKIRGTWQEFSGIPLMVTYHPSYVLRYGSNSVKRTVWEDMIQVMERAGMAVSERQRGFFLPKKD